MPSEVEPKGSQKPTGSCTPRSFAKVRKGEAAYTPSFPSRHGKAILEGQPDTRPHGQAAVHQLSAHLGFRLQGGRWV